jgi:hypothetical protein
MERYSLKDGSCFRCAAIDHECVRCTFETCLQCSPTYYVDADTCQLCRDYNPDCIECTSRELCTRCVADKYAKGGQCLLCSDFDPNCEECSNDKCTKCTSNTFLNA